MSRTGRPPKAIPTVEWKVYIRSDLAAQVELLLTDPMREKVRYGKRGQLIEQLLEAWLKTQRVAVASTVSHLSEVIRGDLDETP